MIALSILTIGFLGISSLLVQSFALARVTADQTTATYLAAEGIEIAKNLIDHDVYGHIATPPVTAGWGTCFGLSLGGSVNFQMDYATTVCPPPLYNSASPQRLKLDPATGLYSYSVGSVTTPYAREIKVSMPAAGNGEEIVVDSIVTWSVNNLTNQTVELEDVFYNWHP